MRVLLPASVLLCTVWDFLQNNILYLPSDILLLPVDCSLRFHRKHTDRSHLNILQLGDDIAKALGVNVELTRIYLTAIGALLAASAVSVAGLLGFVGLIVPHTARLLVGSDYRYLIPSSALLGIAVVTYSDTFARVAFAPLELPVGIFMAILGAPFFLFLLRKEL